MNAVILAGGEGTRLRPLTLERPKPMVELFGRPVLEHILLLLRRNGFDRVAVTLGYQAERIRSYFGDGSAWGMELVYYEEPEPLGTAGSVGQARDFLGDEPFLVISGDCVCDFDLRGCYERHMSRDAEVTLLLHREKDPLEYGLVQLDEEGKIVRFLEKPGWGQVFTNLVNTGIYIINPRMLEQVPTEGSFDFSRDLFPALLEQGAALYGDVPYGYWRDMGDVGAYLQAAADALDGKVKLELTLPQIRPGVWCDSPIPERAAVVPPCWIAARVTVGERCLIGPHTVLESGSFLGDRTVAQRSVLLGAAAGPGSTLHGAILDRNSTTGAGCQLSEDTVLGAEAALGDHVILREEVRIWPRIPVESGSRLTASVTGGAAIPHASFEGGAIRGALAREITPELLLTLGNILGQEGRVALGAVPGAGCTALLMAASAGVSAAGGIPWVHDGSTWGSALWLAGQGQARRSLFIEARGEQCLLWVWDEHGQPLSPRACRGIEGALRRQELRRAPATAMGGQERALGIDTAYCAAAARQAGAVVHPALTLCVPGEGGENRLLRQALEQHGCTLIRERRKGIPAFWVDRGGRLLFAEDEQGSAVTPERLMLAGVSALVSMGEERLALPWDAPQRCKQLLDELGAQIVPREAEDYAELSLRQNALRDGIFAACLLAGHMGRSGVTLRGWLEELPALGITRSELTLESSRGALMEELHRIWPQAEADREGIRVQLSGGWAWLRPAADRPVLRIRTEGDNVELATELCDFVRARAKRLDRGEK